MLLGVDKVMSLLTMLPLHELGENDPIHTELLGAPPPPRNSPKDVE